MDWKDYSGRIKQFGTAIRKGDTARVTAIVVKKDMIELNRFLADTRARKPSARYL